MVWKGSLRRGGVEHPLIRRILLNMGIVPEELIKEIESVLQTCMPQLEFACLYGSCARGEMRPYSDIDIGLYVPEDPEILTLGDVTGRLESNLGRPVDILLLRGLPERDPELAFRVASEGVLITEHRRHRYADFKKQAYLYYLDTQHLRELMRSTLRHRVLKGNMGRRNYLRASDL